MSLLQKVSGRVNNAFIVNASINIVNGFHTSSIRQLDQHYRKKKRLTENPNAFGPLTNLPDYTYLDGRPTPFGVRQTTRINKQRDYLKKIRKLVSDVDYAVENYEKLTKHEEDEKQNIVTGKFKQKGQSVLDTEKHNDS